MTPLQRTARNYGIPIALGGIALYFVGRKLSFWGPTKTKRVIIRKTDLPTGGKGIPLIGTDATTGKPIPWNPSPLAKALYAAMKGLMGSGWLGDELDKFAQLPTDDMFKAVYLSFNQLYASEKGGTLRDWIKDEMICYQCPRDEIYNRMDRMGLT